MTGAATAAAAVAVAAALALAAAGCGGSTGSSRTGPTTPTAGVLAPGATGSSRARAARAAQQAELMRLVAAGRPIYCAPRRGNMVALTFDDGPGPYSALALRKLRAHRDHATFFLVGKELGLAKARGIPRRERAIGAVGDHTWTHPLLTALPAAGVRSELSRDQIAVARASGGPVELFRPPYGARNASIDATARALGMVEIIWDVDSRDSEGANHAAIAANVKRGLLPGSIILMHENRGQTIRALVAILPALARRHLRAVSVPALLAADPPSARFLARGRHSCPVVPSGGVGANGG